MLLHIHGHTQGVNVYTFTPPSDGCYTFDTCDQIYADLAIAIMETCGDTDTQMVCLDDTPDCKYINEPPPPDTPIPGLAFYTDPVNMVGGQPYPIYLGQYCEEDNPVDCAPLATDALQPSTITITSVSCSP